MAGQHDDRCPPPGAGQAPGGLDEREAVHHRHLQVHKDHVNGALSQQFEALAAVLRIVQVPDSGRGQHCADDRAHLRIVVDDEDVERRQPRVVRHRQRSLFQRNDPQPERVQVGLAKRG